jgi:hypothetical protein
MDLESIAGAKGGGCEDAPRTRFIRLQRALYLPHLDGRPLPALPPVPGRAGEGNEGAARALQATLGLLALLERQGEVLSREPLPPMKAKFLATWQRVRASLEAEERLALLAALWTFESERPGLDLAGILAVARRFGGLMRAMSAGL